MSEIPNCAITLYFYEGPPPRFSFFCANSDRGWYVEPDGSIHPPSKSRIVQISLSGFPAGVQFAGLQFAETNSFLDSSPWTAPTGLEQFGVAVTIPGGTYPPSNDGPTTGPLILTFDTNADSRLFYRLAVSSENGLFWHDPKIYDDGSQ
jgi:hypothetical protein